LDFQLTDEQRLLRDTVRDFARNEVAPVAEELDRTKSFPYEIVAKMADLGLMGIPFPEEFEGGGGDTLSYVLTVEELTRIDSSVAITLCAHTSLGTQPIHLFGSEEQKQRLMPDLCAGRKLGAFGLTEPEAGSDAGNTKTRAKLDGGEWVIDGTKQFITNAGTEISGHVVITALTGENEISNVIVENGTEGYEQGEPYRKMGWNASDTRPLSFSGCRVPEANLLGPRGAGFKQFMHILDIGRIGVAAMGVEVPGDPGEDRRPLGPDRSGASAHLSRRTREGRRQLLHAHRRPGEVDHGATRGPRERGGGTDPRWLRLHRGVPGVPLLSRRQDPHHRGGNRRSAADGDRAHAGLLNVWSDRSQLPTPFCGFVGIATKTCPTQRPKLRVESSCPRRREC